MADLPAYQVPIHERIDRDYSWGDSTPEQRNAADVVRHKFKELAHEVVMITPSSRERSIALNALQEAKMWFVQSIFTGGNFDG